MSVRFVKVSLSARRAWIEITAAVDKPKDVPSLSARRAWIEMMLPCPAPMSLWSLSARRAWIEIMKEANKAIDEYVALRKESVDRNNFHLTPFCTRIFSRSPQGERG